LTRESPAGSVHTLARVFGFTHLFAQMFAQQIVLVARIPGKSAQEEGGCTNDSEQRIGENQSKCGREANPHNPDDKGNQRKSKAKRGPKNRVALPCR